MKDITLQKLNVLHAVFNNDKDSKTTNQKEHYFNSRLFCSLSSRVFLCIGWYFLTVCVWKCF